jgi:hypothetical protein
MDTKVDEQPQPPLTDDISPKGAANSKIINEDDLKSPQPVSFLLLFGTMVLYMLVLHSISLLPARSFIHFSSSYFHGVYDGDLAISSIIKC